MNDVQMSQLYYMAKAIYDAPWNSSVHFGCECGCGGDGYTMAEWDAAGDDEKEAIEFFRRLGIRVMAGEVPA